MSITGLMRRLSLIGIDAIWQLSLGCLLMRTIASFLRYTGYLNFINGPISRFIANASACTTTELPILLTACLTAIKNRVIKYCTTVYERNAKNLFWSIKNLGEILNKLKSRGFLASCLSTYDAQRKKRALKGRFSHFKFLTFFNRYTRGVQYVMKTAQ